MNPMPNATTWGHHTIEWGRRTYVMGILNVTPDSFSGDGLAPDGTSSEHVVRQAIVRAQQMVADGADILDVGGESTRPVTADHPPLDPATERARVVPVIAALHEALPPDVIISIDTYKASVAADALRAGAAMVNDVCGLRRDSHMAQVVADARVPVILMSNLRGEPRRDPLGDLVRHLAWSIDLALSAGVDWNHIILDPGIGFGLTVEENLVVLRRLGELRALGRPLLVGTSRKSTIGKVLGGLPEDQRIEGTAATVALAIGKGADAVRVHDVREMVRVARMADAVVRGWQS